MKEYVVSFNKTTYNMADRFGVEAANLVDMTKIGLPVPFGFNVSAEACCDYYEHNGKIPNGLWSQIEASVADLQDVMKSNFSDSKEPLLLNLKGGIVFTAFGLPEILYNVGMNDDICESIGNKSRDNDFANKIYLKYMQEYGKLVYGISDTRFRNTYDNFRTQNESRMEEIVIAYKKLLLSENKKGLPTDSYEQLKDIIKSIFVLWKSDRLSLFKKINSNPKESICSLSIQGMTYGHAINEDIKGVIISRNPLDGTKSVYGEYESFKSDLLKEQSNAIKDIEELNKEKPQLFQELCEIAALLETRYKDIQSIDFQIINGKIKILKSCASKRTAKAAIKIAVDMVNEKLIDKETAISKIDVHNIQNILLPRFINEGNYEELIVARGKSLSTGDATGRLCFDLDSAIFWESKKQKVILAKQYITPFDLAGIVASEGIITQNSTKTSHSAVIARGFGKPSVSIGDNGIIDEENKRIEINGYIFEEGQYISLSGESGNIYCGKIPTETEKFSIETKTLLEWADQNKSLNVRVNANSIKEIQLAMNFGVNGIGLCRTEHLFFKEEQLLEFRKVILGVTGDEVKIALERLKEFQKDDFLSIYRAMGEKPVTIRLLDPSYSEFLPSSMKGKMDLASQLHMELEYLEKKIEDIIDTNPGLGYRGIRHLIEHPEILKIQIEALIEAALIVNEEMKISIVPEILIPFVCGATEFKYIKNMISQMINSYLKFNNKKIRWEIGAMLETPRAVIIADYIAKEADFISYGTNDLTQLTYGLSREDTRLLVKNYIRKEILCEDPFEILDLIGVGRLMEHSIELAKRVNPDIKIAICGEQSADPQTIRFCQKIGVDYLSCSVYQLAIAKISSAQIKTKIT